MELPETFAIVMFLGIPVATGVPANSISKVPLYVPAISSSIG